MLVSFLAVTAISGWFFVQATSDSGIGPTPLHYTLLSTNLLLLFGLFASVARYLIRLLGESREGILGSRFKLKLVASFIGLCLLPSVVLYLVAITILFGAVDRVLGPEVDAIVADAQAQTNQFLEDAETDTAKELQDLAAGLARGILITPEKREELRSRLEAELPARELIAARLHFRGRAEALEVTSPVFASRSTHSPLDPSDLVPGEFEADLAALLSGSGFAPRRWQREGELFLVAGEALVPPGHDRPAGVLFVARLVPAEMRDSVARLSALRQQHNRVRAQVPWLKAEWALLFMGFVLFTVLGATWVGLYIARGITVPIQRLAEGTLEIRQGRFDHQVEWKGADELAVLVEGFNDMARALKTQSQEVEGKTSELEEANTELARRRDEMAQLVENLSAGVVALDADGRVTMANRAARQALQLASEAQPGRLLSELLEGEAHAELRDTIGAALGHESLRRSRELVLLGPAGTAHLQLVMTDLPSAERKGPPGLLVLVEDVTELVRAQKLATWREVARRIAHEIKNPLTPIQLAAQRILKKSRAKAPDLDEALESGVETIVREVGGLKAMVDEFSRFARMPEMKPVRGDLNTLAESVAELYRGHESLDLRLDVQEDLPLVAFDPELLRRALVNLVDNAIEATAGEGPVRLATAHESGRRVVTVEVADGGPGIPAEDREKLFLPYFTTKSHGTGLGLAIVNRILADHGGSVRVREAAGGGASFVLELPLGAGRTVESETRAVGARRPGGGR
jgi:two-component system nitrogen regulation sensor histidine kinase NtrY